MMIISFDSAVVNWSRVLTTIGFSLIFGLVFVHTVGGIASLITPKPSQLDLPASPPASQSACSTAGGTWISEAGVCEGPLTVEIMWNKQNDDYAQTLRFTLVMGGAAAVAIALLLPSRSPTLVFGLVVGGIMALYYSTQLFTFEIISQRLHVYGLLAILALLAWLGVTRDQTTPS